MLFKQVNNKNNKFNFTQSIYIKHLSIVNDIKFTPREIDIVSCLLNARRTKQIASILEISPRTVTTHYRNIMGRLDCNSQEAIIRFFEESKKLPILREYYKRLIIQSTFGKSLKGLAKQISDPPTSNIVVYWEDLNLKNTLCRYLCIDLKKLKINAKILEFSPGVNSFPHKSKSEFFLFFIEKKNISIVPQELISLKSVDLSSEANYFFSFYTVLNKLLPQLNLEKFFIAFKEKYQRVEAIAQTSVSSISDGTNTRVGKKLHKRISPPYIISCILLGCISIFLIFGIQQFRVNGVSENFSKVDLSPIRSELTIPKNSMLLDNSDLISEINSKTNNQGGIQTVALIGPAGAGKTILARQYALQQKVKLAWEVNADSKNHLTSSFELLAENLAQNEDERKRVAEITNIKADGARSLQLTTFIKSKLKHLSPWVILYDNVEDIADIESLFPRNSSIWGKGKVIITSKNANIQSSNLVQSFVALKELSDAKKWELFSKIIENTGRWSDSQRKEAVAFLAHIPSFPMDVTLSAVLIKESGMPFALFINSLNEKDPNFVRMQQSILKNVLNYKFNRAELIEIVVKKILKECPQLEPIILFCALLNTNYIPVDILRRYIQKLNKSETLLYLFKQELKKHSLLLSGEQSEGNQEVIVVHGNIQEELKNYVMQSNFKRILAQDSIGRMANAILPENDLNDWKQSRLRKLAYYAENFINTTLKHVKIKKSLSNYIVNYYLDVGYLFALIGKIEQANNYCNQALKIYQDFQCGDKYYLARFHILHGYISSNQRQYLSAVKSYLLSLELLQSIYGHNHHKTMLSQNNIGSAYIGVYLFHEGQARELKKAISYLRAGIKIFEKETKEVQENKKYIYIHFLNKFNLSYARFLLGEQKALQEAICILSEFETKIGTDSHMLPIFHCRVAHMYRQISQEKLALAHEEKAKAIWRNNPNPNLSLLYEHRGDYYMKKAKKLSVSQKKIFRTKALISYEEAMRIASLCVPDSNIVEQLHKKIKQSKNSVY